MDHIMQKAEVSSSSEFNMLSDKHTIYWEMLLGLSSKRGINCEEVDDIDKATQLSNEEWLKLEIEYQNLPTP